MDVVVAVLVIGVFAVPLAVCLLLVALGLWRLGREGPIDPHSTGTDWLLERARVTTGRWGGHVALWAGVGALVFGFGLFAFALPAVRG